MNKRALRLLKILSLLPTRPGKSGTRKIVDALRSMGIEATIRMVQRDLSDLSQAFPITCDEENPAGWAWSQASPRQEAFCFDPIVAAILVTVNATRPFQWPSCVESYLTAHIGRAAEVLRAGPKELVEWVSRSRA